MNHCGRHGQFPHFGDAAQQVAPPGVPIRVSPCQQYYKSRNVRDISKDCWDCMYNEYSVVHPNNGGNDKLNKYTCDCNLGAQFTPQNFCQYAKCVETNYNRNKSCGRAYNAIYNGDDVQDDQFLPPFAFANLNCNK